MSGRDKKFGLATGAPWHSRHGRGAVGVVREFAT